MADFILREFDPDIWRAEVVAAVVAEITPMIKQAIAPPRRIVNRPEMAKILGWSESKLDRRTSAKAIPSMLDGDCRMSEVEAVIAAIMAGTAEAEAKAFERRAAKLAAKQAKRGTAEAEAEATERRSAKRAAKKKGAAT